VPVAYVQFMIGFKLAGGPHTAYRW
jgi:hypothetical protein